MNKQKMKQKMNKQKINNKKEKLVPCRLPCRGFNNTTV